jgi:hypothetical protein
MAGRGHDEGRLCRCDRADGGCAGLVVRRLSPERVWELAEELWTASCGELLSARPVLADPRSSRAGASARAAYRRRRAQERDAWPLDWAWWSLGVIGAATVGAWLVGVIVGDSLAGPTALLLSGWIGWRTRLRPAPATTIWRRQAATQRRTVGVLAPLAEGGWLLLHDVTLPGGWTAWSTWRSGPRASGWSGPASARGRLPGRAAVPAGIPRELRSQTHAIGELLKRFVHSGDMLTIHHRDRPQ